MLEHNLCRIIELYSKVQVDYVAGKISLPKAEMEKKHSQMILDKKFQGLSSLREPYLQDNKISSISNITFRILSNLEVPFLQGNLLVDSPAWYLGLNPYLARLQLAGNPWACDCPSSFPSSASSPGTAPRWPTTRSPPVSATRSTSRCCGPCNTTISRNSFSTPASRQVGK